jgi:hypothetical protein
VPFMMNRALRLASVPLALKLRRVLELQWWVRGIGLDVVSSRSAEIQKSILIATNIGGNLNTLAFDIVLGMALRSRGHKVQFSLCDGALSACMYCELNKFKDLRDFKSKKAQKLCTGCTKTGKKLLKAANFHQILIQNKNSFEAEEWDLEIADSGTKRFLAKGRINDPEEYQDVFIEYLMSSRIMNSANKEIFSSQHFDVMVAHHGIYVPQANMVSAAKSFGVPVITWVQGYRKQSFLLGFGDTYHRSLLEDPFTSQELSTDEVREITDYLASRDIGDKDWIRFGKVTKDESCSIDLGANKLKVLLLTNVSWDAQIHYNSRVFSDMHSWIEETILWFSEKPNVDLVIRIHPAEVTGRIKARDPIFEYICGRFPNLPSNIKVIQPEENISTYKLMEICDLGIVFATKAGIELAAIGKPLIVTGESWIRGRGLSSDPESKDEYFNLLGEFVNDPNSLEINVEGALNFAHNFFFKKTRIVNSIKALPYYPYLRPRLKKNWDINDPGLFQIVKDIEEQ